MCKTLHTYRIELADDIIGCARRIELKGPTVFGALSLIAKNFGQELLGSILISAAVLFGALFAFYVLALMLTAVSLIARRTKDRA